MLKNKQTHRVTWGQIVHSLRLIQPKDYDATAEWISRELRRREPTSDSEYPFEWALREVTALQSLCRRLANRLPDGTAMGTPKPRPGPVVESEVVPRSFGYREPTPTPEVKITPLERYEHSGYSRDMSKRNGGFGGYHPTLTDSEDDRPVFGVAAYSAIVGVGGIPELGWYFCASDFELGLGTDMIAGLVNGGQTSCSAPTGPGPHETDAATLQRVIRVALAKLRGDQLAILERAYKDRPVDARLVDKHGEGIAALVGWGLDAKAVFVASKSGAFIGAIQSLMCTLAGSKKRARNEWHPISAHEAKRLLEDAHDAYREARGWNQTRPSRPPPRRKRKYEPETLFSVPVGSGKRKLFEAA